MGEHTLTCFPVPRPANLDQFNGEASILWSKVSASGHLTDQAQIIVIRLSRPNRSQERVAGYLCSLLRLHNFFL